MNKNLLFRGYVRRYHRRHGTRRDRNYARDTGDSLVMAGDALVYLAEVSDAAAEPTGIIVVT